MNKIYTPSGWLDFDYMDSLGCWLNVIIGKRQVGKTYGLLKHLLVNDKMHLFTRRTRHELETIATNPLLNPYEKMKREGFNIMLTGSADSVMNIEDYIIEDGKQKPAGKIRGVATSLTEIAAVRGFDGSAFTDWVFDEFIPEEIVIKRKAEGDAFLNAHVTIAGNRELEGLPPLKIWLLANSNSIDSPILEALNLTDDVLYMRRKNKELLKTDNNVLIVQPESSRISEQRAQTPFMRQIDKSSDFYGMAQENRFAYDESPYIKQIPIKNLRPVWAYKDYIYCWERPDGFYICRAPFKGGARYSGSRTDRERLSMDYSILKPYYYAGGVLFSDLRALSVFKNIFNIN